MRITDFSLPYKEGFKILHITDPQIIDSTQSRFVGRLNDFEYNKWLPNKMDEVCLNMIRDLVNRTSPDLILIDGDVIYGQFDDNGSSLKIFLDFISSFNIPFSFAYGNHDNECKKGRKWQSNLIKSYPLALFNDGVSTIGLYDKDILKRSIIMLDSNSCWDASEKSLIDGVNRYNTILESQLNTLNKLKEDIVKEYGYIPPSIICQHIVPKDILDFYIKEGKLSDPFKPYISNSPTEFGSLFEHPHPLDFIELPLAKSLHVDAIFLGHDHVNNLSCLIDDIRVTYVMKTGRYDYHHEDMLGGTLSVLSCDGQVITSNHIYSNK